MDTTQGMLRPHQPATAGNRGHYRVHVAHKQALLPIVSLLALAIVFTTAPASYASGSIAGGGADRAAIGRSMMQGQLPERAPPPHASASTATVRGAVFYNDQRIDGLFAQRRDKDGKPGSQRSSNPNWLAGKYMVVDVIEHDEGFALTDTNCRREEVLTSATVAYDGSFSATFSTDDPCRHDDLSHAAIELRVRLRFCNSSYCFSINTSKNEPYALSHPRASASQPMTVKAGDEITMSTLNFNTAADPAQPNNYSIAANYYASMVDTILALHSDSTIPFYGEEFGEIQYIFPSTRSSTATALSPTEVAISTFQSQPEELGGRFSWPDGKTPAHEYGHIVMQRAWDGDYGFKGVGISAGSAEKAPSEQIAFKEAWAEFVARAVFQPTRGCDRAGFDDNGEIVIDCGAIAQRLAELRNERRQLIDALKLIQHPPARERMEAQLVEIEAQIAVEETRLAECQKDNTETDLSPGKDGNLKGPLGEGAQWRDNIVKALCDWYDTRVDDDPNLVGSGDTFSDTGLYAMWYNLRRMYVDADKYGGEYKNPGLWFCDYVRYYLDVRKSVSAVGQLAHARYEDDIRNLIYNNNIACFMGSPQ